MSGNERIGELAGAKELPLASQVGPALKQVVVVGAAGLASLPLGGSIALMVPSHGGGLLLAVAVLLAVLFGLGTATRQGSALTDRVGLRVGWTLLVATGGTALAGYCLMLLRDIVPFYMSMTLLPALGLALASAALTRPRVVRLSAVALILLVVTAAALATVN
ncbi:hypothetical protein ACFT9M_06220 [Micromonospora purpureochromogenes]|uniref:hypothetical protein n=1 Tax=Micromonospora purpureochromogenes TaxID=47872 RepID=UPI0036440D64